MTAILDMDFSMDLLTYAYEAENHNKAWQLWLTKYPDMTKENFIGFEEFKSMLFENQYTDKTYTEIEEEMSKIVEKYEERR